MKRDSIFWTTILVSFVLLVHNGTEPLFLAAYAFIPFLIAWFYKTKNLKLLAIYLVVFGILGRYTRYFREGYASDAILAVRDYIGYFLAGKNVYHEIVMAQSGPTPFTYLPFSLLWYLPAYILQIDLRFFEMLVSAAVPVLILLYGMIVGGYHYLPVLSVVSLTPFLLDLAADGSNDNSAIVLLLSALVLLRLAQKRKKIWMATVSAVVMALAFGFKHYLGFFAVFFIPYLWTTKVNSRMSGKKYLMIFAGALGLLCLPFVIASPQGFLKSLTFIEIGNYHTVWGWTIWVALRDAWHIEASKTTMWLVRTGGVLATAVLVWRLVKKWRLSTVYFASGTLMLVYLILSNWTTYAYFTFLLPIFALGVIELAADEV